MSGYGPKLDVFEELQRANADLTARAEELGVEIVRLRALIDSDGDKPLPEDEVITRSSKPHTRSEQAGTTCIGKRCAWWEHATRRADSLIS